MNWARRNTLKKGLIALVLTVAGFVLLSAPVAAITLTQQGDVNVTATVLPTSPTIPAVIVTPADGSVFTTTPLVIHGTCDAGLLVRVFDNGALAGSINCDTDGTYVMNITLVAGVNKLTSLNYDSFDQPGPALPAVTITVNIPNVVAAPASAGITIDESGQVEQTAPTTPDTGDQSGNQLLFAGTLVAPITKALNIGTTVSPTVNSVASVAMNSVFLFSVVLLVSLVLL